MNKVTAIAPANIAFIKYWGRSNHELFLPANSSISMNLSNCLTTTTVELHSLLKQDEVEIGQEGRDYKKLLPNTEKNKLVFAQIERIRKMAGSTTHVKIKTQNSFPADSGIASSASGFAALTSALLNAYDLSDKFEDKVELSRQTRLSGAVSAARSCLDGFVELIVNGQNQDAYAIQIAPANHWKLVDLVAVVDHRSKKTSSSQGHLLAETSPYFMTRLEEMRSRIDEVRQSILDQKLSTLGLLIELETISMHTVMMTSRPPIYYWQSGTIEIINKIQLWRENGLEAYFTIDAGANVHIICEEPRAAEVEKNLTQLTCVKQVIKNLPGQGVRLSQKHLS